MRVASATHSHTSSGDSDSAIRSQHVCDGKTNTDCSDADGSMLVDMSSPPHDLLNRPLHYYIDVSNVEDNTYEALERNLGIDPAFHAQLQQENEHDISTFLTLPEIIPER